MPCSIAGTKKSESRWRTLVQAVSRGMLSSEASWLGALNVSRAGLPQATLVSAVEKHANLSTRQTMREFVQYLDQEAANPSAGACAVPLRQLSSRPTLPTLG